MKAPVVLVTAALTVAILLRSVILIATGTRGEEQAPAYDVRSARRLNQRPLPASADKYPANQERETEILESQRPNRRSFESKKSESNATKERIAP